MNAPHTESGKTLLRHEGEISAARSEELFDEARRFVDSGELPRAAFRILVELVQNLRLHGGAKGRVTVVRRDDTIVLESENAAPREAAEKVRQLSEYANLHAADIADVIRRTRLAARTDAAQGAGLGIFEMRRESREPIETSALPLPDGNSVLVIRASLKHKITP